MKGLKRIKYSNIFQNLNVDEIEDTLDLIQEKIFILLNNMKLFQ